MTDTERLRRLDRENEELRDMLNQVAWRLGLGDEVHYYSGDNYLACQLRVLDAINGLIERESDVETVRSDAMDAWRWVREHGGLENVSDAWDEAVNLCATIGCEPNDESEMLQALGDCTDIVIKRLMPEGVEWPRYDTGEPVRIDGAIADELGHAHEVTSVEIFDNGADLRWNPDEPEECVWVGHGERVRRPTPKALDANGVEIGIGDKLYDTETGCAHIVRAINASGTVEFEGYENCGWFTKFLTHRAPVLAADGKPLREGETVYEVGKNYPPFIVSCLPKPGAYRSVKVVYPSGAFTFLDPERLTHTKPEPPDSWERLEEDCAKSDVDYCAERGLLDSSCDVVEGDGSTRHCTDCGCTCGEKMARDLVRRARALAERDC